MSLYEHVFIARSEVSPQRAQALIKEFSEILIAQGGAVGKTEYWGLQPLAYPIKKNHKGHYILLNIEADHLAVGEMERHMKRHDDVLRFLTLHVDSHDNEPSMPMVRKKKPWQEETETLESGDDSSDADSYSTHQNDKEEIVDAASAQEKLEKDPS